MRPACSPFTVTVVDPEPENGGDVDYLQSRAHLQGRGFRPLGSPEVFRGRAEYPADIAESLERTDDDVGRYRLRPGERSSCRGDAHPERRQELDRRPYRRTLRGLRGRRPRTALHGGRYGGRIGKGCGRILHAGYRARHGCRLRSVEQHGRHPREGLRSGGDDGAGETAPRGRRVEGLRGRAHRRGDLHRDGCRRMDGDAERSGRRGMAARPLDRYLRKRSL